jgi:putative tryptophan/tyrosine transport system substrate-binding protein
LTSAIPIVFAATSDPVAAGLVASLAHPGRQRHRFVGAVDRLRQQSVGLLREAVTGLQRVAILTDAPNSGGADEVIE